MSESTIAAVILNYNYVAFLPDAIESVEEQTQPFDEIIVVNDGSTDNSIEVLATYGERIRVLDIPNGGQFGACIAAIRASNADYLYFLDADDCAMPNLVETILPLTASAPVKLQFQLEGVNASREPLQSWFPTFPPSYGATAAKADNEAMGFYLCPPTSGNVYRRETLLQLPLDAMDARDFIDGPATLVLPYFGEIVSLMQPLALYRVHGKNHSQRDAVTTDVLQGELEWFDRRWREACRILDIAEPPFARRAPLYVAERRLMMAALRNDLVIREAITFTRTLFRTQMPLKHKVFLAGWAKALVLPVPALRRSLVASRRSSANRSPWMQRLVSLLGGGHRKTAGK